MRTRIPLALALNALLSVSTARGQQFPGMSEAEHIARLEPPVKRPVRMVLHAVTWAATRTKSGNTMRHRRVCLLFALLASAKVAFGHGVDHVLFDFRGKDTAEGWRLNIYSTNEKGVQRGGSGKMERVAGKHEVEKAMRFSSQQAGSYNFISPEIPEGTWRDRWTT